MIIPEKADVFVQMVYSKALFDRTTLQNRKYEQSELITCSVLGVRMKSKDPQFCKYTTLIPVLELTTVICRFMPHLLSW